MAVKAPIWMVSLFDNKVDITAQIIPITLKKIPRILIEETSFRISKLKPIRTRAMKIHCIKFTNSKPWKCNIMAIATGNKQRIRIDWLISI